MRHKVKRIQSKSYQLELLELRKLIYHVLMISDIYLVMGLELYHMDVEILITCFN